MFDEVPELDDPEKSWTTSKNISGWFYYDADGGAYGPFPTEEEAQNRLDDYEHGYYSHSDCPYCDWVM